MGCPCLCPAGKMIHAGATARMKALKLASSEP